MRFVGSLFRRDGIEKYRELRAPLEPDDERQDGGWSCTPS
jgi:hypothetical protein